MLLSDFDPKTLKDRLSGQGLRFRTGPFNVSLKTSVPAVASHIAKLYLHSERLEDGDFIDFHVAVHRVAGLRRWVKPQVTFSFDGFEPFKPLPLSQTAAMFEWGLNWCVASSAHQYLIIHSAIMEKNDQGLLLPGTPGSGKSTLCAALIHRGWRLLSDEMALLSFADSMIYPVPRPVSLKNKSIEIIKAFAPEAAWGDRVTGTAKGDIEHMRVPEAGIRNLSTGIRAKYLVFPHYQSGGESKMVALSKGRASMGLIDNTFNFNILGERGFESISGLVNTLECYDFTYPGLNQAIEGIDRITTAAQ